MGGHQLEVKAAKQIPFILHITWDGEYDRDSAEEAVARFYLQFIYNDTYDTYTYNLETGVEKEWDADGKILTYTYLFDTGEHVDGDYSFDWRFGKPGGTTEWGSIGSSFESPKDPRYGEYVKTMCKVRFMDRGTDTVYREVYVPQNFPSYQEALKAIITLSKEGHSFKGWKTEDGIEFNMYMTPVQSAMTIYADWEHPESVLKNNDTHHWYECPDCPGVKTNAEEAHDWDEGKVTKEPTDTEKGVKTFTCQTCGYERTEDIPAKGSGHVHDFGTDWEFDDNTHWHSCSGCDSKSEEGTHGWDGGTVTKEPTDTEKGVKTYTCQICGHEKTEPIPAKGQSTEGGNAGNNGNDGNGGNSGNDSNKENNSNNGIIGDNGSNGGDNSSDSNDNINDEDTNHNANADTDAQAGSNASGEGKEPKTGNTAYVEIYATVAMIAGLSYLLLYFLDGTRGMSEEEKREWVSRIICWARKGCGVRKIVALAIIFIFLCYYHSIGKRANVSVEALFRN